MGSDALYKAKSGGAAGRALCAAACAGAFGALACSSHAPVCRAARCDATSIDVMTWWPDTSNAPGVPLKKAAETQAGVHVTLIQSSSSKDEMLARLKPILEGTDQGTPVDAFQTHPGGDLLRWAPCGGAENNDLRLLNGADGYVDLSDRFEPRVLRGLQCCPSGTDCEHPDVYAVPLGLHQVNHIFINKERFALCESIEVHGPQTLLALLDCLGSGGQRVISVPVADWGECAIGEATCWKARDVAGQSLQYLLESLSLLVSEPNVYEAHWSGQCWERDGGAADSLALQSLEVLDLMRPYLNNGAPGAPKNFEDALKETADGIAAFVIVPDWTKLISGQSQTVAPRPFPGTDETFLFTTDAFALPSVPEASSEAGLRWLDSLLQPKVQADYAGPKGALPALGDHSQVAPLLPSLEAQLPVSFDLTELRAPLNDWAQNRFSEPPPPLGQLLAERFSEAHDRGLLPSGAGDAARCDVALR